MVVGQELLECGAQRREEALRGDDRAIDAGDGLEESGDPLHLRHWLARSRRPLPSQATKRRSKALGDETQRDDVALAVPIRPEIRHEHESNIPSAESHRQTDHRFVPRGQDGRFERRQLVRLQLRRGKRYSEAVLGQGFGTEQDRSPARRVEPEAEQVVLHIECKRVRQRFVPRRQRRAIR